LLRFERCAGGAERDVCGTKYGAVWRRISFPAGGGVRRNTPGARRDNIAGGDKMSRTSTKLLLKFLLTFLAAVIAFYGVSEGALLSILLMSLLAAVLNYLLGDYLILPAFGNIVAAIVDGGLAAAVAFSYGLVDRALATTGVSMLVFGLLIAAAEFFFHRFLRQDGKLTR
jgi:hypothetical protein